MIRITRATIRLCNTTHNRAVSASSAPPQPLRIRLGNELEQPLSTGMMYRLGGGASTSTPLVVKALGAYIKNHSGRYQDVVPISAQPSVPTFHVLRNPSEPNQNEKKRGKKHHEVKTEGSHLDNG